uniref:Uncharacterized protein n=1 Tax=Seriola dumerili TaxID=41447 RepID=A0A3B4V6G4_SERDU
MKCFIQCFNSICCGEEETSVDNSAPEPLTLKESKPGEDNNSHDPSLLHQTVFC